MSQSDQTPTPRIIPGIEKVRRIARPESVVILAATVRAALELRSERVAPLRQQVTKGAYAVPTKELAERFLADQGS
jgi:anti-sigma28 factor (negative regulator of flagellin synthesis)